MNIPTVRGAKRGRGGRGRRVKAIGRSNDGTEAAAGGGGDGDGERQLETTTTTTTKKVELEPEPDISTSSVFPLRPPANSDRLLAAPDYIMSSKKGPAKTVIPLVVDGVNPEGIICLNVQSVPVDPFSNDFNTKHTFCDKLQFLVPCGNIKDFYDKKFGAEIIDDDGEIIEFTVPSTNGLLLPKNCR